MAAGNVDPQHVWVMNVDGFGKQQPTEIEYWTVFPSGHRTASKAVFTHLVFCSNGVECDELRE